MHEVSLVLLCLSVDARLNQRRPQTLSGSANADVLWSHQFGSGCQVNTAPLVVDQNVLVSVHCGSEETLRSVQFTDNASTESWQTVLSSEVNTRSVGDIFIGMPDAHTCRVQLDDTKVWCKDFGSGFGTHGGVNTVSQGFSPEEVIFTLSAVTHQDDLEHQSEIVSLTKVFSRMSASTVYQKADGSSVIAAVSSVSEGSTLSVLTLPSKDLAELMREARMRKFGLVLHCCRRDSFSPFDDRCVPRMLSFATSAV